MNRLFNRLLCLILTLALLLSISAPAYAAADEEYLYDLRIVYGEDLADAQKKLAASEYADYTLYPYNLNEGTEAYIGFIGLGEEPHVYIAYKTTTDVELAITDIAVMDMNGGYSEGSLPAMLEKSMEEYASFAEIYNRVIDYFRLSYDSGSLISSAAYRQLNLYLDPDSGERLGDLLFDDISDEALATILLQGNLNILDNMRSLLAMGVAYNESGLSYLETVAQTAAQMEADPAVFENENWYELSQRITPTFSVFREMIYEYNANKDELDYTDDTNTEDEILYVEYAHITTMLEQTPYLDGQTLADFICNYQETDNSYLTVYPLIAAMNDGQRAMTELCHFYDVVRYSTTETAAEVIEEQILQLEQTCADGVDIYLGVDRNLYSGSFAATSAADRAAASAGRDVGSDIFGRTNAIITYVVTGIATAGNIGLFVYNMIQAHSHAEAAAEVARIVQDANDFLSVGTFTYGSGHLKVTEAIPLLAQKYNIAVDPSSSVLDQATTVVGYFKSNPAMADDANLVGQFTESVRSNTIGMRSQAYEANLAASKGISYAGAWTIFGGVMLAVAAINGGIWIYNYYNPDLTDIPLAMVDVLSTDDGDRYLYYDVVKALDGKAADTNAFEGEAWNALYFTRSYEAGSPLLADIDISYDSNAAAGGYSPVHKFGNMVGFDLNKHAFGDELQIYLSVAQSENQKSGVADVPDVVGTVLSIGGYFITTGLGIAAGMVIIAAAQKAKRRRALQA